MAPPDLLQFHHMHFEPVQSSCVATGEMNSWFPIYGKIANENQQNAQMLYIFSICSTYMFRSCLTIISVRCYRVHLRVKVTEVFKCLTVGFRRV